MNWSIAEARARLSELIKQAQRSPQRVYRRKELAAVVVDPTTFERLEDAGRVTEERSLAEAAAELREVLIAEGAELEIPSRHDRDSQFVEGE